MSNLSSPGLASASAVDDTDDTSDRRRQISDVLQALDDVAAAREQGTTHVSDLRRSAEMSDQSPFLEHGEPGGPPKQDTTSAWGQQYTQGESEYQTPELNPDPELDYSSPGNSLAAPLEFEGEAEQARAGDDYMGEQPSSTKPSGWSTGTPTPEELAGFEELDDWPDEFEDELTALAAGLGVRSATTGEHAPERIGYVPHLIPYQLSGLAAFVPLPPESPLRKFLPPRYRDRRGRATAQHNADDDDDDDQAGAMGARPDRL